MLISRYFEGRYIIFGPCVSVLEKPLLCRLYAERRHCWTSASFRLIRYSLSEGSPNQLLSYLSVIAGVTKIAAVVWKKTADFGLCGRQICHVTTLFTSRQQTRQRQSMSIRHFSVAKITSVITKFMPA